MGIRMLSIKEADWDAFHMSFFIFSTTIFVPGISNIPHYVARTTP
jgi:hypothetical protein